MTCAATRLSTTLLSVLLVLPSLVGCGGEDQPTLRVYAAASLRSVFEGLGAEFEEAHDVSVAFNFSGSSDLAIQIEHGADADVFASADEVTMDRLVAADLVAHEPERFATNTLTVVVPPGNPADVASVADLAKAEVRLVVCAPQVPCGAAADRLAEAAGVAWTPRSEEQSVTDVLNKVITGEADAGLVYVTDALVAGDQAQVLPLDEAAASRNHYPIAALASADDSDLATAFRDYVLSAAGRTALREAGFELP